MDGAVNDPLGVLENWREETSSVRERVVESLKAATAARGYQRVVLGLSGGLDSTVVAFLCVEALGAENVLAVLMPHRATNANSLSLAQGVVNHLGLTSRRVNMSPVVDAYFANFPDANRERRGFVLALQRLGVLVDLGNHYGGFVLQVLNRTDRILRYGEGKIELAITLKPLAELYKTQVQMLADELQIIPEVRKRRPSLEYWAGQGDENDLGHSYQTIDPILYSLIDRQHTPSDLTTKGLPHSVVQWGEDRVRDWNAESDREISGRESMS